MAAGFSTDSLWDICRDVTQDTAVTCVAWSSRTSAARSRDHRCRRSFRFRKSESALHNTIVSSSA